MAEDNNTGLAAEVAETNTPVETPVEKKRRAPRQPKAVAAPAAPDVVTSPAAIASASKPAGPGRGRKAKPVEVDVKPTAKVKRAAKVAPSAKSAKPVAAVTSSAVDEIEDLIALEQENKRLRKLLSDKLRDENADLRKRLGHN